jgi:quinol-cytochrome oxidoreductase complex cytochrome b subunit
MNIFKITIIKSLEIFWGISRIISIKGIDTFTSHGYGYPTTTNLNYFWGLGSILGFLFVIQVLSGLFLTFNYTCLLDFANESVEFICRDVNSGWAFKYWHSIGSTLIFFILYIHIGKALYFRSYRKTLLWFSGILLFFLTMAISFLGYTLPFGSMSLWGATVITNVNFIY